MNQQQDTHFYNFLAEVNIIADSKAENASEVIAELVALLAKNNAGASQLRFRV